jgi:Tfp pilus assembly protein PilE
MTEVLVTIAVITVIMAIAIPAVQTIREASRRTVCRNNLRQIGLALQQYVSTYSQFPKTGSRGPSQAYLLPYIEQAAAYATYVTNMAPWTPSEAAGIPTIELFLCPSDLNASARPHGISYGENRGYCETPGGRQIIDPWPRFNAVFQQARSNVIIRPGSMRDGLSNTASYSELRSFPRANESWFLASPSDFARCGNVQDLSHHCRVTAVAKEQGSFRGISWLSKLYQITGYAHILPPNEKDCVFQPNAGSDHAGVVHTVFCDGSVRWISDSVSDPVWQAIGTISSGDTVND